MNTGRWMQEDPIGIAGGENLYQFNGNNPMSYTDPYGLNPCLIPPVAVACGAVIAGAVVTTVILAQQAQHAVARWGGHLIPTAGPRPSAGERRKVNEIGDAHGCMTCGGAVPGTQSGRWIPNHVPPTSLKLPGEEQQLGPHCQSCSNSQGGQLSQLLRALKDALTGGSAKEPAPLPPDAKEVRNNDGG
jgi:hypothetical protein